MCRTGCCASMDPFWGAAVPPAAHFAARRFAARWLLVFVCLAAAAAAGRAQQSHRGARSACLAGHLAVRCGAGGDEPLDTQYRLGEYNYASDFGSQPFPTLVPMRHFSAKRAAADPVFPVCEPGRWQVIRGSIGSCIGSRAVRSLPLWLLGCGDTTGGGACSLPRLPAVPAMRPPGR